MHRRVLLFWLASIALILGLSAAAARGQAGGQKGAKGFSGQGGARQKCAKGQQFGQRGGMQNGFGQGGFQNPFMQAGGFQNGFGQGGFQNPFMQGGGMQNGLGQGAGMQNVITLNPAQMQMLMQLLQSQNAGLQNGIQAAGQNQQPAALDPAQVQQFLQMVQPPPDRNGNGQRVQPKRKKADPPKEDSDAP